MGKARLATLIAIEMEINRVETMYAFLDCIDVVAHLIMGLFQIEQFGWKSVGTHYQ